MTHPFPRFPSPCETIPLTHFELPRSIIVHVFMLFEHHAPTASSCGILHSGEEGLRYENEYTEFAASSESKTPMDGEIEAFPAGQATHAVKEGSWL